MTSRDENSMHIVKVNPIYLLNKLFAPLEFYKSVPGFNIL